MRQGPSKLLPKQGKFVEEYLKDGNATKAAIAAGYGKSAAYRLMHESPAVVEAIEASRKLAVTTAAYNLEKAMKECDDAIAFAKSCDNGANAYVKAVELKAKLNGLLVEKVDVRAAVGFQVVIKGFSGNS